MSRMICNNITFFLRPASFYCMISSIGNIWYSSEVAMASVLKSIGIKGLEAYLIDVEVSVYGGVAMTSIVGLE